MDALEQERVYGIRCSESPLEEGKKCQRTERWMNRPCTYIPKRSKLVSGFAITPL